MSYMGCYMLGGDDGHTPVPCSDEVGMLLLENAGMRRVVLTKLGVTLETFDNEGDDIVTISTVFLVFDHGWGRGDPVLFETMVFNGPQGGYQRRYTNWDDAVRGHDEAVRLAQEASHTGGVYLNEP